MWQILARLGLGRLGARFAARRAATRVAAGREVRAIEDPSKTQKVIEGFRDAYNHPVAQDIRGKVKTGWGGVKKAGGRIKTGAAAGAGLMGGLALGSLRLGGKAIGKTASAWLLIFPILLWILDFISGINGIQWDVIFTQGGTGFVLKLLYSSPFLLFLGIYFILRMPRTIQELTFSITLIFLFVFIWSVGRANLWVFYHLAFAFGVFVFLLKGFDRDVEIGNAHWFFLLIVVWDVFAFPTFGLFNSNTINNAVLEVLSNKLLFPIWLFYFFTFIEDSGLKKFLLIALWGFYIGYFGLQVVGSYGEVLQEVTGQQREAVIEAPRRVIKNYMDLVRNWVTGQIQYAITGKVEENQYEPLGVTLENVQSAEQKYFEDEDVIVWGTVKARTLDDPINIQVGCFVKDGDDKTDADKVDPEKRFPVFTLEEQDFACTFNGGTLKEGSNTITTFADFNFETLAFLKVYFINRERLRAMIREGQDAFDEFGIVDKNPVAVYTNGPAEIGMETTTPLIGVSEDYIAFPRFSLSMQNRQGWEGRITGLREVVLLFPENANIIDPGEDCNREFKVYSTTDCRNSCDKLVYEECTTVCNNYENQNERASCNRVCEEKSKDCSDQCKFLFEEEGQEYSGYSLTDNEIEEINKKMEDDDFETLQFFSCKFNPVLDVLGATPITTKFIRAKARYNYSVEKPVTVRIEVDTSEREVEEVGGKAVSVNTAIKEKIVEIAEENGVPQDYALALAMIESRIRHCKDGSINCGADNKDMIVIGENTKGGRVVSTDWGVMQINDGVGWREDWFGSGTNAYGCNGETAYDLDCNIKIGLGMIKGHYDAYANNDESYENSVNMNCPTPEYREKYLAYEGWDRAYRAYNGFGCSDKVANNVERFRDSMEQLI